MPDGGAVKWDHPRRCGENRAFCGRYGAAEGSPPQVRGKPKPIITGSSTSRITPAGAGKTLRKIVYQCTREDHPRRCGENISTASHAVGFPGSPPQVRGKPISDTPSSRIWGITPAGAGKTAAVTISIVYPSDHPRRCGENLGCVRCFYSIKGSPPQVRGKRIGLTLGML